MCDAVSTSTPPELSVVMPVYNEEAVIGDVLRGWAAELDSLAIAFEIRAHDDGSTDATWDILRQISAEEPRIMPFRHDNRGHGPTVLRGYREARGEWVFQVDSDDELPCRGFGELWRRRHDYDLLLGWRRNRRADLSRRLVTSVARMSVRWLFGAGIRDVNAPYRLMRRRALERLLERVPANAFAPNVLLSGLAVRGGLRIYQAPVDHRVRRTGSGSLTSRRLLRGALRSFAELIGVALGRRWRDSR